jgi:hypothetical protein
MTSLTLPPSLRRLSAVAGVAFPVTLLLSFATHFAGEFGPRDLLTLRLRYVRPPAERFMELFRSDALSDFVLPHLVIYLALPLVILAALSLASLLSARGPRLAAAGLAMTTVGTIYMGGVFGSWLSFTAAGDVAEHQVQGAIPAVAALIGDPPMLTLTSVLAVLSLGGLMLLAAGLFLTRAVPRWQALAIFLGNAMIVAFMDIDNLMMVGSAIWLAGALPMLRERTPQGAEVAVPAAGA